MLARVLPQEKPERCTKDVLRFALQSNSMCFRCFDSLLVDGLCVTAVANASRPVFVNCRAI